MLLAFRNRRTDFGTKRLGDGGSLLTQWIVKYGYVPIVLIGMAGLAYEIGTGEWRSGDTIVAKASNVAEAPVERGPPTLEIRAEPRMQLAALDPDARLLDDPDQPASKGYIMYANSPTHWTPVPLPDGISSARAPHNNNIRAEIEQAAMLFDVDMQMMKAYARIEFWLQSESQDRQIQVPVPAFQLGVCQILAGRHLRHSRLLDRGGQKVCD